MIGDSTSGSHDDSHVFDTDADRSWIESAHRQHPDATVVIYRRDGFAICTPLESGFEDLPWPPHDRGEAELLLDLILPRDKAHIVDTDARAASTAVASAIVELRSGLLVQLTIDTLSRRSEFAVALLTPTTLANEARFDDVARTVTRLRCTANGEVHSATGPAGSFARSPSAQSTWGLDIIHADHRSAYLEVITAVVQGDALYGTIEIPGTTSSVFLEAIIVADGEHIVIDLHDRSLQASEMRQLEKLRRQFEGFSDTLPLGVFQLGAHGVMRFASQWLVNFLGPEAKQPFGWLSRVHPEDQDTLNELTFDVIDGNPGSIEVRLLSVSEDYVWCRIDAAASRDAQGNLDYIVGFVEDISEMRRLHQHIEQQATFDALTELPNRSRLLEELEERLADRDARQLAVLFIDLDGFKLINDTQGHGVGDIVLLEVAKRFRRAIRPSDLIGRFGGDEFVVVASDLSSEEEALAISRRLHDILATPILADGRIISINASVGIALSEPGAAGPDELIGDADIAMYQAKALGRNRTVLFDAELRERALRRFDMTASLRHAKRRRELHLEYQPIISLDNERIIGAEALVRWIHPNLGRISPAVFIPLAEEIGLIDDVGEFTVEQACADLDALRSAGLVDEEFVVSINVSAQQFENVVALATSTLAAIDQFALRPSQLRFELTESVPLTEIPEAAQRIRQLTSYGFGLAIDDFGTGYSSLGYLTMLPFDVLKLDLSLTAQLEPGSAALAVVDSLTSLAAEMGFSIVAEGIETDKQQLLLTNAGVDHGQGYYISRPISLDGLMEQLRDNHSRPA